MSPFCDWCGWMTPSHHLLYDVLLPWVEPLATVAAFVAAAWAVRVAWRAHTEEVALQQETRRREVEKEKRQQAEQVAVWFIESTSEAGRKSASAWPSAMYVNRSGLPIFNVAFGVQLLDVEVSPVRERRGNDYHSMLPPTNEPVEMGFGLLTSSKFEWLQAASPHSNTPSGRVKIEFTDTADRRWLRDFDGSLTLLGEHYRGDELWVEAFPEDVIEDQPRVRRFRERFPAGSNLDDVSPLEVQNYYRSTCNPPLPPLDPDDA